ncbi:cytochrome b [Pedomonas sp. V897]|uniref:cytochrome b n=1 Tax=Pedomonas sp. V897 TaxID=3446482 RepID=UPI003EE1EF58
MMNDTPDRYGVLTRLIHWTMAALIVLQFLKLGDYINDGEHWVGQTIVPLHGSLGILLFVLIVVRLAWAVSQRGQRPDYDARLRLLVKAGHGLLYLCMILMPLSGMARGLGAGRGIKMFGSQLIEGSGEKTEWLLAFSQIHAPLSWLFVALASGHVLAALYHHFVLKDQTLRRMAG